MTIHQYIIHSADGKKRIESTKGPAGLEKLQAWVGGYIEMVRWGEFTLCVNEEGLLNKLPVNKEFPWLVGTVVVGVRKGEEFWGAGRTRQ